MRAAKRALARLMTWWIRLLLLAVLLSATGILTGPWVPVLPVLMVLVFLRPPRSRRAPVEVDAPVRGRWMAINSPGTKVPSHIHAYGQAYAVDLLHPRAEEERDQAVRPGWRGRPPEEFPCFGEPVRAVAPGTVVRTCDRFRDRRSRDTWPTLVLLMAQGFLRDLGGPSYILGNHVTIDHRDGSYSTYAHLRRGSVAVRPGEPVAAGQVIGAVGNTGNTSEPHLHVQLMDHHVLTAAAGVPMLWRGLELQGDPTGAWATGEPKRSALPGFPQNGQIFLAEEPSAG